MKAYLVDDGIEPVCCWAVNSTQALAIVRREHGFQHTDYEGKTTYQMDADAYCIPLTASPPDRPGLELRPEVLEEASQHVRQD